MPGTFLAVLSILAWAAASLADKLPQPTIQCRPDKSTPTSIRVIYGPGGNVDAKGGHAIHFMTLAEYMANGNQWYVQHPAMCRPRYSETVQAGHTAEHNLGSELAVDGSVVAPSCRRPLKCGTKYVVRSMSRAWLPLDSQQRVLAQDAQQTATDGDLWLNSQPSETIICETAPCVSTGCTHTQSYWKSQALQDGWPVKSLMVGASWYGQKELYKILDSSAIQNGNGFTMMAQQLIAAKINIAAGASSTPVLNAVAEADYLIAKWVAGEGPLQITDTSRIARVLQSYNGGELGVPLCSDSIHAQDVLTEAYTVSVKEAKPAAVDNEQPR